MGNAYSERNNDHQNKGKHIQDIYYKKNKQLNKICDKLRNTKTNPQPKILSEKMRGAQGNSPVNASSVASSSFIHSTQDSGIVAKKWFQWREVLEKLEKLCPNFHWAASCQSWIQLAGDQWPERTVIDAGKVMSRFPMSSNWSFYTSSQRSQILANKD